MQILFLFLFLFLFLIIIGLYIFYILKYKKVPEPEIQQTIQKKSVVEEEKYYIDIGSKSIVKYYYYPIYYFKDYKSKELYAKIIIKNNWIKEPFHTIFVTILNFLYDHDDCIKSQTTASFKIKIANTNSSAYAYKVYSLKELILSTIENVYDQVQNEYNVKDIQNILLATLLCKVDLFRSMSTVYKDIDSMNFSKIFLDKYDNKHIVLDVIKMIKNHHKQFNFINTTFENSKKYAKEYPYEDSEINNTCLLSISEYKLNINKKLLDYDSFNVHENVQKVFY